MTHLTCYMTHMTHLTCHLSGARVHALGHHRKKGSGAPTHTEVLASGCEHLKPALSSQKSPPLPQHTSPTLPQPARSSVACG